MKSLPFVLFLSPRPRRAPLPAADEDYVPGPDAMVKEGVPQGKVTQHTLKGSTIFPGTERDYWVYVPAQYDAAKPACLMVFFDGGGFVSDKGAFRVPTVFDNLIQAGEMPVTVGVFVNPGVILRRRRARSRARIAASNTTPSAIRTPASCWRNSCPRSGRQ